MMELIKRRDKTMNTAIIAQHLGIAESAIVRIEEWANVLFIVARKLGARFVSKKVIKVSNITTNKFRLIISNMPARGKCGWVRQGDTFLSATSQDSHGISAQKLTFELEDGVYEVQDAQFGSRRTNRYWLKVENGEGTEIDKPKANGLKLPELEGSEKQIAWAESIRGKAITKIFKMQKLAELEMIQCILESHEPGLIQAKWWIDNRDRIDSSLQSKLKGLVVASIKSYPTQEWEAYADEYAHEGEGGEFIWKCKGLNYEVFPGKADVEDLAFNIFCQHPESKKWEVWHYTPSIY